MTVNNAINIPFGTKANTAGNLFINDGLVWNSHAILGDGSLSSTGTLIITKTNGVPFAASATIDTTNASNISSGTLDISRTNATAINTPSTIISRDINGNFSASQITYYNGIITNNSAALTGTNIALQFASALSDGNYINLGGTGRNIGVTNTGVSFSSFGLNWDATNNTYVYSNSSQAATTIESSFAGIFFKYATSGTAGASVAPTTGMLMETNGNVTVANLTASQLVATNASKVLISLAYASANTASAVVQRDGSGNFNAGTITATFSGSLSGATATLSQTPTSSVFPINCSSGAAGTYISYGGGSRAGIIAGGELFSARNFAYDSTNGFTFINGAGAGTGFLTRMGNSTFLIQYATGGTAGGAASLVNSFLVSNSNVSVATGDLSIDTAGKTLKIKQGANACAGTGVSLTGGTATVLTSAAATGDIILLTCTAAGGTQGIVRYSISNGASFTITSSSGTDTSTYSWVIIKAA